MVAENIVGWERTRELQYDVQYAQYMYLYVRVRRAYVHILRYAPYNTIPLSARPAELKRAIICFAHFLAEEDRRRRRTLVNERSFIFGLSSLPTYSTQIGGPGPGPGVDSERFTTGRRPPRYCTYTKSVPPLPPGHFVFHLLIIVSSYFLRSSSYTPPPPPPPIPPPSHPRFIMRIIIIGYDVIRTGENEYGTIARQKQVVVVVVVVVVVLLLPLLLLLLLLRFLICCTCRQIRLCTVPYRTVAYRSVAYCSRKYFLKQ